MNKKKQTGDAGGTATTPKFGEIAATPDPQKFRVLHPSDQAEYDLVNKKLIQPIPVPRDPDNMVLTLDQAWGSAKKAAGIKKVGKIVFHATGDTGPTHGPKNVEKVADKMTNDFDGEEDGEVPSFLFHLGDVVYSFGEANYYYDQFYDPFRNYPAPILAIPGNHDGLVYKGDPAPTCQAFLDNFVTAEPHHSDDAGSLMRTTMTQPGVYFAFDAPYVTIIGLYSNVLEDPGVISGEGGKWDVTDEQLAFLSKQLKRVKNAGTAVIVAVHHPPFAWGGDHAGSPEMLKELDKICNDVDFWPHAFLSGHVHNYQRFTRTVNKYDVPYVCCGCGGHNIGILKDTNKAPLRAPSNLSDDLIFENYGEEYGYLRIVCDDKILRIEYHDDNPDQKTYSDAVTIDIKSHTMISN